MPFMDRPMLVLVNFKNFSQKANLEMCGGWRSLWPSSDSDDGLLTGTVLLTLLVHKLKIFKNLWGPSHFYMNFSCMTSMRR